MNKTINEIFNSQVENRKTIRLTGYKDRRKKIRKVARWVYDNRQEIQDALYKDFKKPRVEVDMAEIYVTLDHAKHTLKNLKFWMKPERVLSSFPAFFSKSQIEYYPKGTCLIISPWNYPFQLTISPLISAIAAGNCAILKPSEITPHTSRLISKMIDELFSNNEIAVIEGDKNVAAELLSLPFNHIFYTGSSEVGKIVMGSAAKNLTSITLELGGKSPTIVDGTYNLKKAAKRIVKGKFLNAGQTCIAPDYIVVKDSMKKEFIEYLSNEINSVYGASELQNRSEDLCRIVNQNHYDRLKAILDENSDSIVYGGMVDVDDLFISPTIFDIKSENSNIMKSEIFGPLLPVLSFDSENNLHSIISNFPSPLVIYIFSNKKSFISDINKNLDSGATCINDIGIHFLNHNLPFGGVGNSGMGHSHGLSSFISFSNQRSVMKRSPLDMLDILSPPYTNRLKKILNLMIDRYKNI